ncbi:hypothetical protein BC628DRAFT_1307921 [Trametes gibbosa]|uniref:RING-type domain-containing protein n=1 Tax=Trametes gibbosa TaxID=160864 RepID=A0A6G6FQH8_9APHY|nr:hypothetical protein BC628DRAFT_1307921 [Trametes gibbosa]QIE48549.1 hypothetical protein [Trametes gibbosa]
MAETASDTYPSRHGEKDGAGSSHGADGEPIHDLRTGGLKAVLAPSSSPLLASASLEPGSSTSLLTEACAQSLSQGGSAVQLSNAPDTSPVHEVEPLAAYPCPICFSPPTYATITPCGHVLCGDCLFTAVKTTMQRGAYTLPAGERMIARCPVCRAPIPGWDGKGGGVIGLRPRAVFSL